MPFDLSEILSATMILFAVIDIVGSIPLIITVREKVGHIQSGKATIVALGIMIAFLFIGEQLLRLLGVDINSFAIAGSMVLFFLALEMILGVRIYKDDEPETASIVPIAFPLIAGAGSMTTLITIRAEFHSVNIVAAIIINCIIVYFVLKNSMRIGNLIGKSGIGILRKAFGVILMAIAVKLFFGNISQLL